MKRVIMLVVRTSDVAFHCVYGYENISQAGVILLISAKARIAQRISRLK